MEGIDLDFRYFTAKNGGANVQADKERRNQERSRRAAVEISNQVPMVVDQAITELEPVIGESSRPPTEEARGENLPVEDVEGPEDAILDATSPLFRREEEEIRKIRPDNTAWYPFLNKEYLIGSLLLGYLHKLISRDLYHQIRSKIDGADVQYQSKLEMHLISDIPYDDDRLKVVSVNEFSLIYEEIAIKNGLKLSECCGGKMIDENNVDLIFPNPWRTKAAGKILRHVPINLYCDDTSGNKSKKWNKHISYYFTLSGLPPKISNQQFNCHFLCTSNIAGPLELGEMVVEQLNDMATNGFVAYDSTIGKEVHVMTSSLCFLADSPMHAEITNTHVPGNALNSCRYCVLRSEDLKSRKKLPYLAQFTQKNLHGANCPNQLRTMEETIINSKKLWTETKETLDLDKLNKKSAKLAVRDQLNLKFSKQVFAFQAEKISLLAAGEELPPHMDQDIPQKLVDMEKDEPLRMHNSFMRLKGFDSVKDTPVEVLHVFLLGPVKYLFRDFMKGLNDIQKSELLALCYNVDKFSAHWAYNSIWMVQKPGYQTSYFFHTTLFQKLEQNDFYKMREIKRTPHETFVHTSNILTGLNVQHDCHQSGCQLEATRTAIVERRKSSQKNLELNHRDEDRYIINFSSLASVSWHRKFSDLLFSSPTQLEWIDIMHDGLNEWSRVTEKQATKANKRNHDLRGTNGPELTVRIVGTGTYLIDVH
ncbi:hypothetical protein KEM48_010973 [Puccinia striiformis f. sp. tritici PST-130]|nr:hypothetical protein KEM48_010973 [Puccinia striiformis f. sp. tritici PST-130]